MKPDFENMATGMISAANPQLRVTVAAALRAAYAAGLDFPKAAACSELSAAIRAEKDTDHG